VCSNYSLSNYRAKFLQSLTALLKGRAPRPPRVLELEASSDLLQVSLPYPKGRLRRRHVFIMPRPVCIYVYKSVLQFYVCFCAFIPHVVSYLFPCLIFSLSCAILSQTGLLEVPAAYRGPLGYFLARSLLLLNGCSSNAPERRMPLSKTITITWIASH
jgi:hypothetical protein